MPETPRTEPAKTDRLRLRYVTRNEEPLLQELFAYEAGGFNDFGLGPRSAPDELWTDGEMRTDRRGTFFVERLPDGVTLGTISYHRVSYGPNDASGAWMIGIELLPVARGQGYGTEAQRLLADWLFDTTDANRVEASTDVDNAAEARSLEKAGFTREGVNRGAQFRAGAYHDLVLYSRLRSDP
jgi:RimJ/RimL family protein N-acetyltransferase